MKKLMILDALCNFAQRCYTYTQPLPTPLPYAVLLALLTLRLHANIPHTLSRNPHLRPPRYLRHKPGTPAAAHIDTQRDTAVGDPGSTSLT
jgi:hypothetical protein